MKDIIEVVLETKARWTEREFQLVKMIEHLYILNTQLEQRIMYDKTVDVDLQKDIHFMCTKGMFRLSDMYHQLGESTHLFMKHFVDEMEGYKEIKEMKEMD